MTEIRFKGKKIDTDEEVYGNYVSFVIHGVMRYFIIPCNIICFDDVKLKNVLIEISPESLGVSRIRKSWSEL